MQQHSSKTAYVYSDKLLQYRFHDTSLQSNAFKINNRATFECKFIVSRTNSTT